jgi:Ca2+-binding RTX toxin-like protein
VGVISLPVTAAHDSPEYTIMTYRSFVNQDLAANDTYTNEEFGYPQSLMMLDIAALQHLYGADFNANSADTVYRFSATTGEMFINGAGQGAPGANRLFLTVWDGGGTDTYDFSGYTTGVKVNLAPGGFSLAADSQRAQLDDGLSSPGVIRYASGNVYNALQYLGDARSLIENAAGGSANDRIEGNAAGNGLTGNAGNDTLIGRTGADQLAGGANEDQLIADGAVTWSAEAATVHRLYLATLGRAPDDAGHQAWIDQLAGGQKLSSVAAGFVNSAEFQTAYGSLDNTKFVTLLYNNVLDRAPDAAGLQSWVSAMTGGMARADVVTGFSESQEFRNATAITSYSGQIFRMYDTTFNRMADAAGMAGWQEQRYAGQSLADLATSFMASQEFINTYGTLSALTNAAFVTLLYQNVLNRAPDAGGLTFWTGELAAGTKSRPQALIDFSESSEHVSLMAPSFDGFMRSGMGNFADTLTGGAGNDKLTGGYGSDRFVFTASEGGSDTVYGFEGFDTLQLTGFGYASSAAALAAVSQQGANAVLTYAGGSITFAETQLSVLQGLTAQGWVLG